ncbi:MAG: helix-turn-helix transcriptional regulator [Gemmatimonadota bacterium]|nr:helix-turn-helix transcriptional regulator [Gemmatimonadota bacterium]MDE2727626.1 helix-turn-helix transcriptional regulator [Gemmatimonadota bacterium]MYB61580.1 helix-turn-helix domain-containing protein [Gemmatimonadota bacterium]
MTSVNIHVGSDFDDYLKEEGLTQEVERVAIKRVVAYQVGQYMLNQGLTKTEMARRMHTSRASLDRLLDPENSSVTLQTLERAARALGRRLHIALV